MPSSVLLKAMGLNYSPNNLDLQDGSLIQANNIIIRRDNVIESRRGFKLYGDPLPETTDRAKQLLNYKGRILRHYGDTLQFDDGTGTFTSFSGNYSETEAGLRLKGLETNGNFYFTTNSGVKKIASTSATNLTTSTITQAGGVKAIDFTAKVITELGDQTSFFTADSALAYRIVWGIKDANSNLILGSPSQRVEVYNSLQTILIQDLVNTLTSLDQINQVGSLITDGDYLNSLKLPITASASDIRTNLISLTDKLDNDILYANDTGIGAPLTISSAVIVATTGTITFTGGTVSDYFDIGSKIFLNNFLTFTGDLDGGQVITFVDATTIEFTTSAVGPVTFLGASIVDNEYRSIVQPAAPGIPTTHVELVDIQVYLQSILIKLKAEPDVVISSILKTTYIDTLDVTNASYVELTINIPQDITTDYFYQVYRSSVTLSESGTVLTTDIFPSDELQLVYESFPTQTEINTGFLVIQDITPDEFRGANLYTNASTGEGILQANDVPPLAKDINKFKEYTFFANTKTKHRELISMLGITNMITDFNNSITPTLTIASQTSSNTYSFILGNEQEVDITCVADVADSLNGIYFLLNNALNTNLYYVWYKTSGGAVADPAIADRIGIRVDILTNDSATNVASETRDKIAFYVTDFVTDSALAVLTISNTEVGYSDTPDIATSGFSVSVITSGIGEKVTQEISQFTCVADVAASLASTYFTINTAFGKEQYYVWYKVTGVGTDPAIANKTGFLVNISTNDSATDVAQKTATAINLSLPTKFTAVDSSGILTITNYRFGPAINSTVGTSGFSLSISQNGALDVLLSSVVSPSKAVDETARSLIRVINENKRESIYGFYLSGVQEIPGKMNFEARELSDSAFYLVANNNNTGNSFNPVITPDGQITIISIGDPITNLITTSSNHGLITGDTIIITASNSTPNIDGYQTVTVVSPTTFRIVETITNPGTLGAFSKSSNTEVSENESKSNRVYYSKFQQPEAVPIVNYFDVGSEDRAILRIFPLRDSLFVFKEDGLYRISGESAPFSKGLFDSSCILSAPDSLSVANNQLYCWTTQGIVTATEAGVSIISRSIDTEILKLGSSQYPNFKTVTWGVGYESDNSYLLFTNTELADTEATICFRYSNLTSTWTNFDKTNTCGAINSGDDKLYLGAGDVQYIEQERKSFTRYDYADREVSTNLTANKYFGSTIQLSSITNINAGDVLIQDQTLTTYEYNNLLNKLDIDIFLADTNYFSTLEAFGGNSLYEKLDLLINKIANDSGRLAQVGFTPILTYTALSPTPTNFAGLQSTYNSLIVLMNADVGVGFANYNELDNGTTQEAVILSVNKITKVITLNVTLDYIIGPMTVFNSIETSYTYAPITLGDPLGLKHMRESTLMFANKAFTNATLTFSSDLLPVEEMVDFNGDGSGIFGHQSFGSNYFGGGSNSAPFRTYIPRNKQRCRFLIVKFSHKIAREQYAIYGLTLTGEVGQSSRGYR